MSNSPRLALPYLAAGQAQKEFYHNEALATLDFIVAAAVEGAIQNDPPSAPAVGASYIVGPSPTGAWTGKAGQLASFGSGGWRYAAPVDGMNALLKDSGVRATYRGGAWETGVVRASSVVIGEAQILSTRSGAIPSPSGGTIVDTQARGAIDAILDALRHHGLIQTQV